MKFNLGSNLYLYFEVMAYLREVGHPAVNMERILKEGESSKFTITVSDSETIIAMSLKYPELRWTM